MSQNIRKENPGTSHGNRFTVPQPAIWTGLDESDEILCPHCHEVLALVDEDPDFRPKHCPECGTKITYERNRKQGM